MITEEPIRLEDVFASPLDPASGGLVTFYGVVRSPNDGREVKSIHYDCYRPMAEREIERIIEEIGREHPVEAVRIIHRIGEVAAGELSMVVVVAACHRSEAFAAAQDTIDRVKQSVPIWKKECYADASSQWR